MSGGTSEDDMKGMKIDACVNKDNNEIHILTISAQYPTLQPVRLNLINQSIKSLVLKSDPTNPNCPGQQGVDYPKILLRDGTECSEPGADNPANCPESIEQLFGTSVNLNFYTSDSIELQSLALSQVGIQFFKTILKVMNFSASIQDLVTDTIDSDQIQTLFENTIEEANSMDGLRQVILVKDTISLASTVTGIIGAFLINGALVDENHQSYDLNNLMSCLIHQAENNDDGGSQNYGEDNSDDDGCGEQQQDNNSESSGYCSYNPPPESCTNRYREYCHNEEDCIGVGGYWCQVGQNSYSCMDDSYYCPPACSSENTYSCFTENDCAYAGGHWCQVGQYSYSCMKTGNVDHYCPPACSSENTYSCFTENDCTDVGGYWVEYDSYDSNECSEYYDLVNLRSSERDTQQKIIKK